MGLSADGQRVRYRIGEGVTGRVVETGKPVVVPQVSQEPMFLNRAGRRRYSPSLGNHVSSAFRSSINQKPVGSLERGLALRQETATTSRAVKFFGVVASMIAQAVKINRLVDAERRRLLEENVHLREELLERYDFSNLIGNSGPIRRVYEQVTQVASTNTTVMLRGESGTGKELIAHAIHYNSPRKNSPFIKVNCAALPETLIESELFGYEKGAFTGAHSQKKGRFELAEGGTLFLDEIGDLNTSTAVKLLRVLQEKEFDRLGGTKTVKADVRLIVATNKDLEKAIAGGRISRGPLLPVECVCDFRAAAARTQIGRAAAGRSFSGEIFEPARQEHQENLHAGDRHADELPLAGQCSRTGKHHREGRAGVRRQRDSRPSLPPTLQTAEASGTVMNVSFKEAVEAYEKDLIQDTLKTTRGNRSKAASLLKTTDRVINYKIKKLNIDCNRFRS